MHRILLSLTLYSAPLFAADTVKEAPESSGAATGVTDPALAALLTEHWGFLMSRWPTWATRLGDHRYDDRLDDISSGAIEADRLAREAFHVRAQSIDPAMLTPADVLTLSLFRADLAAGLGTEVCHTEQWGLSARNNPLVNLGSLGEGLDLSTTKAKADYFQRLGAFADYVAADQANLSAGIAAGRTPERDSVRVVISQLDMQLSEPPEKWSVVLPLSAVGQGAAGTKVVRTQIRPALRDYRRFLQETLLPASRSPDRAGVWALPEGAACYAALVTRETSLSLSPEQIHATGLAELEAIHAEIRIIGQRVFGTDDLSQIFSHLRNDPKLRFESEAEVEAAANEALAAAKAAVPRAFGRLPQADCKVRRVPAHEAPYTTIAYYWPAVPGEAPGYYTVNTYAPTTRPRFEARALAFHESIPGHHFQIALAQELPALPAFRRHLGSTAFVEGWALYTERLADELGLYRDDLDRLGMLSFDTWRATRLVVDTGIHAKGWTRQQAEVFFHMNTPLAENNIRNEVDRYITWPGQALAYKLGQIEIRQLRQEAETRLGSSFSLPAFHDTLLGSGAVPMPVLREIVETWIRDQESEKEGPR